MNMISFHQFLMFIMIGIACNANLIHSENLDTLMLSIEQTSAQIDKQSWFWNEYEFSSDVVNREELRITDIQIWQDSDLQQNVTNWQYIRHNNEHYIVGAKNSTLLLYHFDHQNSIVTLRANLAIAETIKSFEAISFSSNNKESTEIKDSIVVILSIENEKGTQYLKWFYLQNHKFYPFWIWELLKMVKSLKYFNLNEKHKLLVLYEKDVYFNQSYSLVEVYDIKTSRQLSKQLCCKFLVNEVSDIRICSTQEGSKTFALMDNYRVTLHEYEDLTKCVLKPVKNIIISNISNMICFESSNINHFAVSGFVTNFFKFQSNEFVYEEDMETLLNEVGDVHFITNLSIDTYRKDAVLLIQSKNLTVFALCWQNAKFQFIRLPNNNLNHFNLSKVMIIPNYGLLVGNTFVKLKVELAPLSKPNESGIENLFRTKFTLEAILNAQESKISDIELEKQSTSLNNLKIDNLSSSTNIDVDNLLVNKTNTFMISMESSNFTLEELQINYEESKTLLYELEAEISHLENQVEETVEISLSDIPFVEEIYIAGNLDISGTAVVKSIFTNYLNDVNVDILLNNCLASNAKIIGNKMFPSIKFSDGNLKIKRLNGVPLENFLFDKTHPDYIDIDLDKIKKLEVKGNLNSPKINDIDWNILMDQIVLRNQSKVIPGRTILSGVMETRFIRASYLNNFKYPLDYVVRSGPENGDVTGTKTIETLTISDLKDVKTINGIDADEFIILTADQNLEHPIIFENVRIDESLQIDGKINGLPEQYVNPDLTLLNSNIIQSNVIFTNLNISGKVYVQNLIDGIEWSELDDLILKNDKNVIVSGMKNFTHNVQILGNLEIKTSIINEHPIKSFITLDTPQIMPSLSKITGDVKFTRVTYEDLENIEDKLRIDVDDFGAPRCSMKPFVFLKSPIVDEFSTSFINENITGSDFSDRLANSLNDINFVNLKCKKCIIPKLKAFKVNGINIKELQDKKITKSTFQELSGVTKINTFKPRKFHTRFINNRSYEQLQSTIQKINSLYNEFLDGEKPIYLLNTNKFVTTSNINGINLHDFLNLNEISEFLLRTNGSIENLTVKKFVNGLNFTEKYSDCVLKTEEFITIKGPKKINRLTTKNLYVQYINSHSAQDIITDARNQTLVGPLIVKGSVYVKETFNSHGKINDVNSKSINVDIKKLNNTVYTLTGNFSIDDHTSLTNLIVAGRLQERDVNEFIENLIYLNDTEIIISSSKVFNGAVKFNNYITVSKKLNDIDLESFYKNAISIDNSRLVNSAIIFENDVLLEEDLIVVDSLKANTIKGINVDNLIENAVYFNRPTAIMESVTLSNVIFKSDVTVTFWNNTNLNMLLTLNKDEVIQDTLICVNANVENVTIRGSLNNENLTKVYENTFMISTDQNIKGEMLFQNDIYVHGNLISRYINDVNITKLVSLETSDMMAGNFVFESPVVCNNNVTVLQYLNNINISQWQHNSIISSSSTKSIISGNWTIYGNIDFKENVNGPGFINNISIDSLSNTVRRQSEEIKGFIWDETENIKTICKNLQDHKNQTDYLLHKFKSFEYLRVLQFDKKIESVHHIEFNSTDYILVNFETCHVDIYAYTNEGFLLFANASVFGNMKQYLTFNYKNNLYLVTVGRVKCGRNPGNLWMLENDRIKHMYDFGNVTSIAKLSEVTFVLIADHQVQEWSIINLHRNIFEPLNIRSILDNNIRFLKNGSDLLLASCDIIYSFQNGVSELDEIKNPFKSIDISSFQAGIHQKEYILLHDDEINGDHIFIYDQDLFQPNELQSIHTHKPNSFTVINFDGLYESLLIFSENKKEIKIYEYKGIEYFKFHSSIQMKVDKIYSFQLKTHSYFVKRQCIAILHDKKLTILEAKMYGEKLNANNQYICSTM